MMNESILKYIYHEDCDIHEFKPYSSKRDAVAEYINILDRIVPETIEKKSACALIIWNLEEAEIFPLRLQSAYFKQMVEKYPNIPPAYVLYLTDRPTDQTLIDAHYTTNHDIRKTYALNKREEGIQWLLKCREKLQKA